MKLPEDQEEKKQVSPSIILTVAAVTAFVGCLFILVFFWNKKSDNPDDNKTETGIAAANYEPTVADLSDLLTGSTLSPDDLDFWDQYPLESSKENQDGTIGKEGNKESSLEGSKKGTKEGKKDGTKVDAKEGAKEETKVATNDEKDPIAAGDFRRCALCRDARSHRKNAPRSAARARLCGAAHARGRRQRAHQHSGQLGSLRNARRRQPRGGAHHGAGAFAGWGDFGRGHLNVFSGKMSI